MIRWGLLALFIVAVGSLAIALYRLPHPDAAVRVTRAPAPMPEWPVIQPIPADSWLVMRLRDGMAEATQGPLAERFRLAGTFFAYPGPAGQSHRPGSRRAIIDDLQEGHQRLVREGDQIDQVAVVHIYRDRIVLRDVTGDEELRLSYTGEIPEEAPTETAQAGILRRGERRNIFTRFEDMPALEENRFGRRVAENRWILDREALMAYTDDIRDEPERLTALFMAMQPDFDDDDQIAGFQLDMLGENELYEATGFQNGDIVRSVNSMPMTNPDRATYFIREFMEGRVSALVFDIERDGEDHRMIHLIR